MGLSTWPTVTDDDGSLILGTVFNKALTDAIRTSIEADLISVANPTVTAENVIDEVVTARGSKASLDDRLDVALNDDGTLKTAVSLVTATQAASIIGQPNLGRNDDMSNWPSGVSAAPAGYVLSGGGAAVAKAGTGLGDTTNVGAGKYCAKLTYGAATAILTQSVLTSQELTDFTKLLGRTVTFGILCKTSTASQASIVFDDGVGTTRGGSSGNATYHSGNGTVQWIYGTHTISGSASKLEVSLQVATAGSAYFGGLLVIVSDIAVTQHTPFLVKPRAFYPEILHVDGATYKQGTPADAGLTGWSYVLSGGTLKNDGDMLRITCGLDTVGTANTPTEIKLYFGSAVHNFRLANDATKVDGAVIWYVLRQSATTQLIWAIGSTWVLTSSGGHIAGTETLSGDITIATRHGASASGTDYIQQKGIVIEYLAKPY